MSCKKTRQSRKKFCISDFRHNVKIYRGSIIATSGQYTVDNCQLILSCRAKVKTTGGSSFYGQVALDNAPTHKFTVPYVKDISIERNYVIEMNKEYYNIDDVTNLDEDNIYFVISAVKKGSIKKEANWR